jgi:macrolide-specific efflux system membrane fusion protein
VENALRVPASALQPAEKTQEGNSYTVEVMTNSGSETRPVEVGLISRTDVEILSGLAAGERVIVGRAMPGAPADARGRPGGMRTRGPSL